MPQPLLQYEMAVIGRRAVEQALASVERRAARINRIAGVGRPGTSGARVTASKASVDRLEQRAHQTRIRQIRAESARRIAAHQRAIQAASRADARAHRQRIKAIEREAGRREAGAKRAAAAEERWRERSLRRAARATILDRERTTARRLVERRALIGGAVGRAGAATAGVGRAAIGALGLGGGLLFAGAMRHRINLEKQAGRLAVKAYGTPGETRSKEQIQAAVIRTAEAEGVRTGFGAEGIVRGLSGVVAKTGSLAGAEQIIGTLGDIADATASDIGEVGDVAGILIQSMTAKGMAMPEALAQTTTALNAFAQQAKEGSIEFEQLTGIGAKIVAPSARFGGEIGKTIAMLGGIAQQAIAGGAASAEEAGTAVMRFADDVVKNSKRFEKMGVNIWEGKAGGKLASPEQIITQTIAQTGGDIRKVTELFGIRGFKAVEPFVQRYQKVSAAAGGGKVGMEAGLTELGKVFAQIEKTTMAQAEIRRSAAFRRQNVDKKIAIEMEKFRVEIGTKLLPTVTKLIPKLGEMIPAIATVIQKLVEMASWALENPFKGLGLVFAASLTKELASAGIARLFARALGGVGAGTGGGIGVPGAGAGGAAGKRAFLGGGAGMGYQAALAGVTVAAGAAAMAIESDVNARNEANRTGVMRDVGQSETLRKARKELRTTGELSPETQKQLDKMKAELTARLVATTGGAPTWASAAVGEMFGGRGFGHRAMVERDTQNIFGLEQMRDEAARLLTAGESERLERGGPGTIAGAVGEGMGRTGVASSLAAITAPVKAERKSAAEQIENAAYKQKEAAESQAQAITNFSSAISDFGTAVDRFKRDEPPNTGDSPTKP